MSRAHPLPGGPTRRHLQAQLPRRRQGRERSLRYVSLPEQRRPPEQGPKGPSALSKSVVSFAHLLSRDVLKPSSVFGHDALSGRCRRSLNNDIEGVLSLHYQFYSHQRDYTSPRALGDRTLQTAKRRAPPVPSALRINVSLPRVSYTAGSPERGDRPGPSRFPFH